MIMYDKLQGIMIEGRIITAKVEFEESVISQKKAGRRKKTPSNQRGFIQ